MKRGIALASTLALIIGAFAAPAAQGVENSPDIEIVQALASVPGGYSTGEHTAYWPELGMTMTSKLAIPPMAVGSCPTGYICAYSGPALTGNQLSWAGCSTYAISRLAIVRSVANARTSGTLYARNGTTVVATVTAGRKAEILSPVTNLQCR